MKRRSLICILALVVFLAIVALDWHRYVPAVWTRGLQKQISGKVEMASPISVAYEPIPEEIQTRSEAFKKEVQTVMKTLTRVDLPESSSKFGSDQCFQMAPEDAIYLIEIFQKMDKKRVNIFGVLNGVSTSKQKIDESWGRYHFLPGFFRIAIKPEGGGWAQFGQPRPFELGDDYTLYLDPKTGWAKIGRAHV